MESVNVAAFLQQVRDRGYAIDDAGVTHGVRRFAIAQGENRVFFDIDEIAWPDVTQAWLLRQVELATSTWPR